MRGYRTLKLILILVLVMHLSAGASLDSRVTARLTGGVVSTKNYAIWQLYQYRDTKLLQKFPYCPSKAYFAVNRYVTIECIDNKNSICINTNLKQLLQADTAYNRKFGKKFKVSGSIKHQVRQIYTYCKNTQYTKGLKTARDVFTLRKGDCAAISAAFYVLCKAHKIPVQYVIGWYHECHAWNRVKIGSKWYWIDATMGYWISKKQYAGYKVMEVW